MMDRRQHADGYEPGSTICPPDMITNRKLTSYDDLYDSNIPQNPKYRKRGLATVTKRKTPEARFERGQDASAKRPRLDGQRQAVSATHPRPPAPVDLQKRVSPAEDEKLWQRRGGRLPAEIWQHVFTYLSPHQLGNLLAVNRLFHVLLHPSPRPSLQNSVPGPSSSPSVLPFLMPDTIWQVSRRVFSPNMPAPLKGKSELSMWRIVCGRSCQFCGNAEATTADHAISEVDPWHRGPGAKGVSPVFPFGIVTCGPCLVEKSVKELDLILSSVPSALHPALPAAFLTSDLHIVSPATLQRGSDFSTNEKPSRIYWPEHIEQVKTEFESVRSLGLAAAEEWLKGLDARGKKALVDASRWEKWELAGGRRRLRELVLPPHSGNTNLETTTSPSVTTSRLPPKTQPANETEPGASVQNTGEATQTILFVDRADSCQTAIGPKPTINNIPGLNTALPRKTQAETQSSSTSFTVENTKAHSDWQKAQRRAEIERRAAALSPPIPPNVLAHIFSFKAALQVPSPLDEQAWEVLKPLLLAQREAAVQKVRENEAESLTVRPTSAPLEVPDALWDEAQGPLRARLVGYADDIIAKQWEDGDRVSKKTSARFAVEVLLHVRKSFYADVERDAAAAYAAGKEPIIDPPQGPWTQKLTIENMKWIFDLKIRPLTEKHKKEPFFCNGCTQQKTFGLEGVIQHYAAKHNSGLSRGSIVVFWRAEWPDVSPFSPDPTRPGVAVQPKSSTKSQGLQKQVAQTKAEQPLKRATAPVHVLAAPPTGPASGDTLSTSNEAAIQHELTAGPETAMGHGIVTSIATPTLQPPPQSILPGYVPQPSRVKFMDQIARQTWQVIMNTSGAASIKATILIHHATKSFWDEYHETVPLDMFAAWVRRCPEPSPASMLKKVQCKSCLGKQSFKFDALLQHFKTVHMEKNKQGAGWCTEMVWLPHINELRKLPQMLKNSPVALQLAVNAMPWALDAPQGPGLSQQQQAQYTLPTRPTSTVAPGTTSTVGSSAALKPAQADKHQAPQQGFHITKSNPIPVSFAAAPPEAPTGPAAMTSKSRKVPSRGQAQALPVLPQKHPASDSESAPATVDEVMEDTYSPPPPEAYQTHGPAQIVNGDGASSQIPTSAPVPNAEKTKSSGTAPARTPKKSSSYYHRENKPILRPAREVYSSTKQKSNGDPAATSHGEPPRAPTVPRAARQPPSQPPGDDPHNHSQPGAPGSVAQGFQNGSRNHHPALPQYHGDIRTTNAAPPRGRQPTQPATTRRRRSVSPTSEGIQVPPLYRERSPPRHYYEAPPPSVGGYMSGEFADYRRGVDYELVRVRDPAGDYLIRRPIRQEMYGYDARVPPPPPVAMEYPHQPHFPETYSQPAYAPYPPAQRASTVAPYPIYHGQQQTASLAPPPQAYGPPIAYDEYDPHDPARLPPPRKHRFETEARY